MPLIEKIRQALPLKVGGATLGTFYLNVHGPGEVAAWSINVMSGWVLERDGQILLTQDDRCNEDQNGPVSFLVGTCLGDVEGPEPDGRDFVFVFSDGTRLYIFPDDGPYESYVFKAPKWFVEVFGPATGECVDPAA